MNHPNKIINVKVAKSKNGGYALLWQEIDHETGEILHCNCQNDLQANNLDDAKKEAAERLDVYPHEVKTANTLNDTLTRIHEKLKKLAYDSQNGVGSRERWETIQEAINIVEEETAQYEKDRY